MVQIQDQKVIGSNLTNARWPLLGLLSGALNLPHTVSVSQFGWMCLLNAEDVDVNGTVTLTRNQLLNT